MSNSRANHDMHGTRRMIDRSSTADACAHEDRIRLAHLRKMEARSRRVPRRQKAPSIPTLDRPTHESGVEVDRPTINSVGAGGDVILALFPVMSLMTEWTVPCAEAAGADPNHVVLSMA
jgi:hypothetical protein